jgi:hypothetical protein
METGKAKAITYEPPDRRQEAKREEHWNRRGTKEGDGLTHVGN